MRGFLAVRFNTSVVRTARRLGIKLQAGIIQFFKPDTRSVKAHQGVFADQLEKRAAIFFAVSIFCFVREVPQDVVLLRGREIHEFLPVQPL
jgi:hypothetical protein